MIIKRISHKKIQVERNIDIYCGAIRIGEVLVKSRYKYGEGYPDPILIPMREVFYNKLSNKYGIKKKFIFFRTKNININFEDQSVALRQCPDFIDFNDVDWFLKYNRNEILSNLLS